MGKFWCRWWWLMTTADGGGRLMVVLRLFWALSCCFAGERVAAGRGSVREMVGAAEGGWRQWGGAWWRRRRFGRILREKEEEIVERGATFSLFLYPLMRCGPTQLRLVAPPVSRHVAQQEHDTWRLFDPHAKIRQKTTSHKFSENISSMSRKW